MVLLTIFLIISISACGKVGEKIAQKGVEKAVEKATGGKVDISNDGGKIEVDGQSFAFGEKLSWPKDAMGDLPEPKAVVNAVMQGEENKGSMVILSGFEDGKGYVQKLKDMGYADVMNMEDTQGFVYIGKKTINDQKSAVVNITYNLESKDGSITYGLE